MTIHYIAIVIAAIIQFIIGAVWYSFIFGKLWGKIHGFDALPKEVQQQMMKKMGPFYALQFFVTIVTTFVLALFIAGLPEWNSYGIAFHLWLGFVVPTQISAVIFGGTEGKWMVKKIAVQAGASLVCLMAAVGVLAMFQ
jgi:hypothetical protein